MPVAQRSLAALGLSPNGLQALLIVAGLSCCIAMSMPQVHIVAYCADLGYGVARGAEMLSLMLGFGIVSRVGSGWLADRVGGAMTLLHRLDRCRRVALVLYLMADSAHLALPRLGAVRPVPGRHRAVLCHHRARVLPAARGRLPGRPHRLLDHLGMALGGWMGGMLFDITGSYRAPSSMVLAGTC